jgi:hypothetical protein
MSKERMPPTQRILLDFNLNLLVRKLNEGRLEKKEHSLRYGFALIVRARRDTNGYRHDPRPTDSLLRACYALLEESRWDLVDLKSTLDDVSRRIGKQVLVIIRRVVELYPERTQQYDHVVFGLNSRRRTLKKKSKNPQDIVAVVRFDFCPVGILTSIIKGGKTVGKTEYDEVIATLVSIFSHYYPLRFSTISALKCRDIISATPKPHGCSVIQFTNVKVSHGGETHYLMRAFPEEVMCLLRGYINGVRKSSAEELFVDYFGRPFDSQQMQSLVKIWFRKLNPGKDFVCSTLRRALIDTLSPANDSTSNRPGAAEHTAEVARRHYRYLTDDQAYESLCQYLRSLFSKRDEWGCGTATLHDMLFGPFLRRLGHARKR